MAFFEFLTSIWRTMFQLLWFGRKSLTNKLSIYVKSNTGSTVSVNLDPKWDIKEVKEVIAPKLGMAPEEVKLILAGKELDDSTVIEDCDLGERSILHAVRSPNKNESRGSRPLNSVLSELSVSEEEDETGESETPRPVNTARFFIWCSSKCKAMKKGKLRVRCFECKSGAITVDSDPSSWNDVLQPKQISGHCEQIDCPAGAFSWAEFYFKCSEHTSEGESDTAVPLNLIRYNYKEIPCLACTDVIDVVLVFNCNHVTCLDCFITYCTSRLRERSFQSHPVHGYTLPCPARCSDSDISEPHHFKLLPVQLYTQYQRFGAEEYVLKSGGVLCPQPGCGAGILPDETCITKITCLNGCGYVFCRNCLQGYHLGECTPAELISANNSYPVNLDHAAQARWNEESRVAIRITTKPCPQCRTPTERAGGCMHMVCTRCNLDWCWVCQTEWTRDCMGSHWFG